MNDNELKVPSLALFKDYEKLERIFLSSASDEDKRSEFQKKIAKNQAFNAYIFMHKDLYKMRRSLRVSSETWRYMEFIAKLVARLHDDIEESKRFLEGCVIDHLKVPRFIEPRGKWVTNETVIKGIFSRNGVKIWQVSDGKRRVSVYKKSDILTFRDEIKSLSLKLVRQPGGVLQKEADRGKRVSYTQPDRIFVNELSSKLKMSPAQFKLFRLQRPSFPSPAGLYEGDTYWRRSAVADWLSVNTI